MILLTQDSTPIIGQVAWILGKIMDCIFIVIDKIGIPNVGLAIIIFTIIVNLLMLPLTIKQQKFSKLSMKMQPEIQAIQNKYKNKKDQDSQMAMSQEINGVYAKYGVSPVGSCGYLLIQMPILFALYRVIYAMPAYVGKIGDAFNELAVKIITTDGGAFILNNETKTIANTVRMYTKQVGKNEIKGIIDILNRTSTADMATIAEHYGLSDMTINGHLILSRIAEDGTVIERGLIDIYNNFLGLNIGNSPSYIVNEAIHNGAWLLVAGAIAIPVLSALTQWINVKLMPQQPQSQDMGDTASAMQSSMKTMNIVMPIFSAWLCFSMPAGMGLYWVAGSVVRSIQQVLINKYIDRLDFDKLIEKNKEKSAKKMEKLRANQEKMNQYANMSTKNINTRNISTNTERINTMKNKADTSKVTNKEVNKNYKPGDGSMRAKANMVRDFNESNKK